MTSVQPGEITLSPMDHVGSAAPEEEPLLTARRAVKDIAFGSIAGTVAEVFEYPFDLAKVRLQAQLLTPASNTMMFNGPMDCLMQTWREEGVRGLYRGLPAPIIGSMAETAALFVAYTTFQNLIRTYTTSSSYTSVSPPLSIPLLGLAAGGAGFVTSFVLTPIELVKCKMQVQMLNFYPDPSPASGRIPRRLTPNYNSLSPYYFNRTAHSQPQGRPFHEVAYKSSALNSVETLRPPGPIALIRSIVDTYGVRGLWLGHTGTILRETGGTASWFVAKEWVARQLVERRLLQSPHLTCSDVLPTAANTELLVWESAVSGALAGAIGALLFYPADTVKSAIQTEEELRPRGTLTSSRSTFIGTFRKMWYKHGIKGLYAGCGMTVARAIPSSGIIFVVYDGLTAYFA